MSTEANEIGFTAFNLNPNTERFIPQSIHSISPITLFNPCAGIYIPNFFQKKLSLNSYDIFQGKNSTTNVVWKYSLNPYAKVFTRTYKSLKMLNYDAKIFITCHRAFLGVRVISIILLIIFILILVILSVLHNSGKQCVGELSPNKIFKKLKISNPNKLMIGHLNINSIIINLNALRTL